VIDVRAVFQQGDRDLDVSALPDALPRPQPPRGGLLLVLLRLIPRSVSIGGTRRRAPRSSSGGWGTGCAARTCRTSPGTAEQQAAAHPRLGGIRARDQEPMSPAVHPCR
jgi:hypothetical protein